MFTHFAPSLILPETFEPILRQRGVPRGVLYVSVPEVGLQRAGIVAVIRELVAAGVAEHVGMGLNFQPGGDGCTLHYAGELSRTTHIKFIAHNFNSSRGHALLQRGFYVSL
jgi:hypothetical protein